jgi:integrase
VGGEVEARTSREELKAMLDHADNLMHRAYILCQTQSGLSVSDLLRLTVNNINEVEPGYIHLHLTRGKEKQLGFFDTFFGKMATSTLKEYLKMRKLNPASRRILCTPQNVRHFLARLSDRAGVSFRVGSHTLRKYFYTNLSLARVNSPAFNDTLIEYWMGHSLGKVKGAYFIPPMEEQLRLYKLAETRLEPNC